MAFNKNKKTDLEINSTSSKNSKNNYTTKQTSIN